ncbi:MAG: hypothetical protein H0Z19_09955, partial [Archaeoglobus sp.]|uniref:phage minor head protein n=1 Tax=Archaeoglobus sp. TaxID=1872626 RepID=UPI001D3BD348
ARKWRLNTIARTEVIRASNYGRYEAWKKSRVVVGKEWVTAFDDRTCPECASCDGDQAPLEKPFRCGVMMPPAHPNCYTEGHLVWTLDGWKRFDEVKEGDLVWSLNPETLELEPARVECVIKYWHDGEVYHIYNKWFDMEVTPEHDMWIKTKYRKSLRKVKPAELKNHFMIPRTAKWRGEHPEYIEVAGFKFVTEDFVRFMAWYLAEGSVSIRTKYKQAVHKEITTKYEIKITQHKPEQLEEIYELSRRMFDNLAGVWKAKDAVYIRSKQLDPFAEWLKSLGHSAEKYIPGEIKRLAPELLKMFLLTFAKGDGYIRKPKAYKGGNFSEEIVVFTSSKRLMNDLAELIIKAGWQFKLTIQEVRGKKQKFDNSEYVINNDMYVLRIKRSKFAHVHNLTIEKREYHGFAYDVELDKNHVLLVMRNGFIAWSGNCRCTAIPIIDRQLAGLAKGKYDDEKKYVKPKRRELRVKTIEAAYAKHLLSTFRKAFDEIIAIWERYGRLLV